MGPGGSSEFDADCAHSKGMAQKESKRSALYLDMNFHLVDGIVQVAAGIPYGCGGLRAALAVGSSGHDHIVAGFWSLPLQTEHTPSEASFVFPQLRGEPRTAAVDGDLDLGDVCVAGPGDALNLYVRVHGGTVGGICNRRLYVQSGDRVGVLRFDRVSRLHRLVGHPVARTHEVAFEFLVEH